MNPSVPAIAEGPPLPLEGLQRASTWQRLRSDKMLLFAAAVIAVLVAGALLVPILTPFGYRSQDYDNIYADPGTSHWLGTDGLGRDVLSRLAEGARVSLSVGVLSQLIVVAIGLAVGVGAAMGNRYVDGLLMRFTDVAYAFPDLLFIILLRAVFGGGLLMITLAIALVQWTTMARLVRAQVLSLKEREFALAAHAMGACRTRVVFRHLLPNSLGPIVVAVAFGVPQAIFAESALSFIGIGVSPPLPSWGSMVQDGYQAVYSHPHLVLAPAAAIAAVMLAFTFLGDALRDALDPRTRI